VIRLSRLLRRGVAPELAMLNQALYDEFVRTTGATSRRDFGLWVRALREGVCAGMGDTLIWAELGSCSQSALLVGRASATPPAAWPSIDLSGA
jgi:hypothetical protein